MMVEGHPFRLYGTEFKANPHPTYAAMRSLDPVHCRLGQQDDRAIWYVTRYAEAEAVMLDHRRLIMDYRRILPASSFEESQKRSQEAPSDESAQSRIVRLLSRHMLNLDPPDHTRLRGLVNSAFTARQVQRMAGRIQAIATELLDRVAHRGEMDLVADYAWPLSTRVIGELLGISAARHNYFHGWSSTMVSPFTPASKLHKRAPYLLAFLNSLEALFARRRTDPQDDLLTALLQAEEAGERLAEEELFGMVVLLIVAGHDTVAHLLGNAVLALLQHPEQLSWLQADLSRMGSAVDELVRYEGPVERATPRFALEDLYLNGRLIRRGDPVNVVLAAASRDPERYAQPDQLDLGREQRRHMGFGMGAHYCLGAPLARLEVELGLQLLFLRLPHLRLARPADQLRWHTAPITRGLKKLPLTW